VPEREARLLHEPHLRRLRTTALNPEPYAYESGFAVRSVIERQLAGDPDLNYDPNAGPVASPWLAWGPYLWADGLTPRSDGLTWACSELQSDGTHPSPTGQLKVADSLLAFFRWDATTAPWYRIPGTLAAGPRHRGVSLAAAPNPSRGDVTFTVTAPAGERWKLSLHDAAGRVLMRRVAVGGRAHSIRWDGQDTRGAPAPRVYWASSRAGQAVRQVLDGRE
jgi:hypothetical protein